MRTASWRRWSAAFLGAASFALLLTLPTLASPAGAAAGYPPTTVTPTVPPGVCNATVVLGANGTGTATCTLCHFAPGSSVSYSYAGFTGRLAADVLGCIKIDITTTDPCVPNLKMSVNGGPLLPVSVTGTTIEVGGTAVNTAVLTDAVYVDFPNSNCVTSVIHPAVTPSFAFTGADIVAMVMGALVLVRWGCCSSSPPGSGPGREQ